MSPNLTVYLFGDGSRLKAGMTVRVAAFSSGKIVSAYFQKNFIRMNNPTITLRPPLPGDMGWVVQQHGEIYWREYGWDAPFEALVLNIVSGIVQKWQPAHEKCCIAEVDGVRAGSAFVVRKSKTTAQLRLLILTPDAWGLGLGGRLCDECIAFARSIGYKKMVLWTNSCLLAARAIYLKRGFRLTKSEPYHGFGHDLVGETWELVL